MNFWISQNIVLIVQVYEGRHVLFLHLSIVYANIISVLYNGFDNNTINNKASLMRDATDADIGTTHA